MIDESAADDVFDDLPGTLAQQLGRAVSEFKVYDPDEYGQADEIDVEAWRDRQAVERELARQRDRRGDPQ
jgi:hypothetical protein